MNGQTEFQKRVWELCKKVPAGRVTTYKEIAAAMESKAYRAVGNALNKNPYSPIVPCHRVIASDGKLGGFSKGLKKKRMLLRKEKIEITNNKISLDKYFFRLRK